MPPSVTIVIPNYNGAALLPELFSSLAAQTLAPDCVLVVDDASTDSSAELAATLGARVLPLDANRGFAAAVNYGVRSASTEWVAILNSDVTLAPDWLAILVEAAAASGADFVCGPLLSATETGSLDGGYDLLSRAACPWRAGSGFPLSSLLAPPDAWLPAFTALLLRRRDFLDLGGLEEAFESYLEDVDFGLRCREAGIRGLFVANAIAFHCGGATFGRWSPRATRLQSRNQLWLVARHYPDGWWRRHGRAILAGQLLWGLLALRHGVFFSWLRGKLEALARWRDMRLGTALLDPARLDADLDAWETAIREWQGAPPRDFYWRWYFRCAGRRAGKPVA
jgi:GT2 family glycosyltransferase